MASEVVKGTPTWIPQSVSVCPRHWCWPFGFVLSFAKLHSQTLWMVFVQLGIWRVPNIPNPMLGPQEFKLSSCVSVQTCPTKLGSCFARSGLRGTPFPEDGFTQLICFRIPKKMRKYARWISHTQDTWIETSSTRVNKLVIAASRGVEALQTLVLNKQRGILDVVAIKEPQSGDRRWVLWIGKL